MQRTLTNAATNNINNNNSNSNNNKMLLHAFILAAVLATAKSAEAEITMEAAFQGHCGHTSPCEQLCYEIHDGMYECDCIEGYELNKNGYSCQVINSTSSGDGHSKSDEDVLYQKGASFSAKLVGNNNNNKRNNNIDEGKLSMLQALEAMGTAASGSLEVNDNDGDGVDDDEEDADDLVNSFFASNMQHRLTEQKAAQLERDAHEQQQQQKQQQQQQRKVNSADYYISAESINFGGNDDQQQQISVVPEKKAKAYSAAVDDDDDDYDDEIDDEDAAGEHDWVLQQRKQQELPNHLVNLQRNKANSGKYQPKQQNQKLLVSKQQPQLPKKQQKQWKALQKSTGTYSSTPRPATIKTEDVGESESSVYDGDDDYYASRPEPLDMAVYDDVNNNQLNWRSQRQRYQAQQMQQTNTQQQQQRQHNTYQQPGQWHVAEVLPTSKQQAQPVQQEQSMSITGAAAIAASGGVSGGAMALLTTTTATAPNDKRNYIHNNNNNNNSNHNNNNNNKDEHTDDFSGLLDVGVDDAETAAIMATNHEILGISMTMTGSSDDAGAATVTATTKDANISMAAAQACTLDCGAEGACSVDGAGALSGAAADSQRCLCAFGKTGDGCMADLKVRVPKFAKRSWLAFPALHGAYKHVQLRIEFRPESFDGIILLSGERDDLTGDFMALLLNKGFVEFWFDCGSGAGSVRSRETILLNEWNSVIIYRHRWDAWLVLNHGTKVQGRSNGLFSRITFREPVFLGGTGNITGLAKRLPVNAGFVGCIRRFVANEHDYKFEEHPLGDVSKGFDIQDCITDKCFTYPCQHGGKCLPSDQGAVCLCPIGFVGDLCEIRMDLQVPAFNGSSFLRYAPLGDSALIWLELKVILKPEQPDGLIMYSGSEKHGDFIALSLSEGFVEFTFDLGSGPAVVRSEYPLTIGQWHTLQVSRTARLAVLKIDQSPEVMIISSNGFWHLSLPQNLFVGGVNHIDHLPLNLKFNPFFVGCIQKIDINGRPLAIISEALGGTNIGNCPHACVARPCGPLAECIPQMESYECRCSAYNVQCNKAAEVPLEELQQHKAAKSKEQPHRLLHESKPEAKSKKFKPTKNGKGHAPYWPKKLTSTLKTTTATPATIKLPQLPHAWSDEHLFADDDIIFRDVHGMHRKRAHREQPAAADQQQRRAQRKFDGSTTTTTAPSTSSTTISSAVSPKQQQTRIAKYLGKGQTWLEKRQQQHKGWGGQKLSRLPAHYASFQTQSESDILTFDDNVEVELLLPGAEESVEKHEASDGDDDDDFWSHEEVVMAPQSDPVPAADALEPFALDELIFDDASDETATYEHKQLAQDMRRIMTNEHVRKPCSTTTSTTTTTTTSTTPAPAKVVIIDDEYNADEAFASDELDADDYSAEDAKLVAETLKQQHKSKGIVDDDVAADDEDDSGNDALLGAIKTITSTVASLPSVPRTPTPQTHTDWSVLKQFELPAAAQQAARMLGVRKNFGACFAGQDSYFHYNDAETMSQIISYNIDLNLRIKTHSTNGVILWTGRQAADEYDEYDSAGEGDDGDFLSLGIENGFLHFRYDLGSGEVDIRYNVTRVSDGLWHRVRAIRNSQAGYLEVDGRKSLTSRTPGRLRQLNTDTGLYVGGLPTSSYFRRRKYGGGIVGCISEIILAGELKLNFDPSALGSSHNVETGIL